MATKTEIRQLEKMFHTFMERTKRGARDLSEFRERGIIAFAEEILGVTPYPKQAELLHAIREHQQVVCAAANSSGKSMAVRIAALDRVFVIEAPVYTAGPTATSMQNILLGGPMSELFHAADLPGELQSTKLVHRPSAFIQIVSPNSVHAGQGRHHPFQMCVIDEAQDPDLDEVWAAFYANTTGEDNRFVAVGNAIVAGGQFEDACNNPDWHFVKITAWDVLDANIPGTLTREKISQWKRRLTPEEYESRINAEFPAAGDERLVVTKELLEASASRHHNLVPPYNGHWHFALDVAREGDDKCVLTALRGGYLVRSHYWGKAKTMASVQKVVEFLRDTYFIVPPAEAANYAPGTVRTATDQYEITVDIVGSGAGVADRLSEKGYNVVEYRGSGSANEKNRFTNLRSEKYWHLADRLHRGELHLPHNPRLWEDLLILRWLYDPQDRFKLLQKEEVKRKLGRSPDDGDSLAMAVPTVRSAVTGMVAGGRNDDLGF